MTLSLCRLAKAYNSSEYVSYFQAKLGALQQKLRASWHGVAVTPTFLHSLNDIVRYAAAFFLSFLN